MANRRRIMLPGQRLKCSVCKEVLTLDHFSNNRRDPYGKSHRCKTCDRADKVARYWALTPEQHEKRRQAQKIYARKAYQSSGRHRTIAAMRQQHAILHEMASDFLALHRRSWVKLCMAGHSIVLEEAEKLYSQLIAEEIKGSALA